MQKTEIFYGAEATTSAAVKLLSRTKESLDAVIDSIAPSVALEVFKNSYLALKEKGVKVRWVTEITKDNIQNCKEAMKFAEIRHLDDIKGNFGVTESEYLATAILEKAKPIPYLITSTIVAIREQHQFLFDMLWKKAIPSNQKIREIEENKLAERTDVIYDHEKISNALNLFIDKIELDVRIIIPKPLMVEQFEEMGVFHDLVSQKQKKNFLVKLVVSFGETHKNIIRRISSTFQYKSIEPLPMGSIILVRDMKEVLLLSFSSYSEEDKSAFDILLQSTDRLVVGTMLSTFDAWWNQVENNLKMKEEKDHAELLLDLITHDLGNHNQIIAPNLELAEIILEKTVEKNASLDTTDIEDLRKYITSAAKAFERSVSLVDNIKRLENMYRKQVVALTEQNLISSIDAALSTVRNSIKIHKEILFSLNFEGKTPLVLADNLLEEVFANLFFNAIKATDEKQVKIDVDIQEHGIADLKYWMIAVSDHGKGIKDEMKSELFTRFYSRATGTGLGLSIVRALVERYGGKIWAGDRVFRDYSKGAKFGFILLQCPI